HSLLDLPQAAAVPLSATSKLPTTSSRSRSPGCRGHRGRPRFPMPRVPKIEHPHPPLLPRTLGFGYGGRNRRSGGAQVSSSRSHGGAEETRPIAVVPSSLSLSPLLN